MTLVIETQPLPLIAESDGVVRVRGTRVTLDSVIYAFLNGATAEEIAQQYPSLMLPDIYSILGYYLNHQIEVNQYLQKRQQQAAKIKQQNEARYDPSGIRERLLSRQTK